MPIQDGVSFCSAFTSYQQSVDYKDRTIVYLKYQLTNKSYLYLDLSYQRQGIIDCLGSMFIDKKILCSYSLGYLIEDDKVAYKGE